MWVHQRSAVEIKQTETDKQQSNITIQILAEQSPHMDEGRGNMKVVLELSSYEHLQYVSFRSFSTPV